MGDMPNSEASRATRERPLDDGLRTRLTREKGRIISCWKTLAALELPMLSSEFVRDFAERGVGVIERLANAFVGQGQRQVPEFEVSTAPRESNKCSTSARPQDLIQLVDAFQVLRRVILQILREKGEVSSLAQDRLLDLLDAELRARLATLSSERDVREESEVSARQIANSLPLIVWTADPDGFVDWYSDWWYEYIGYPRGTRWDDEQRWPMHPDDVALTNKLWYETVAQGKNFQMEQRFRRGSDGQYRWHLVRGVPIRDSQGRICKYIGGNTDIHDQKLLTEELREARVAAEAASQSKSTFLANMSHEIRTPMTAILGFTEILRDAELSQEDRRDAIARIDGSGRALLRLIDDLLDISKIEAGELRVQKARFSPFEVASDVVSLLKLSADQKGVELKLEIGPSLPDTAHSDPMRFRQILTNLVGNAVKFTAEGHVVVRLTAEDNRDLLCDVIDTGIGISVKDQQKLFNAFTQADDSITRTFGGTGLGLMLSRRLSERLGGSLVLAESALGKGSRFRARIEAAPFEFAKRAEAPALAQGARQASLPEGPRTLPSLAGVQVLVAEDVPDNQVLMRRYLESVGARVRIANNGREAVEMALGSDFHVILMDMQMPVMDGVKATRELRSRGFRRPILALTAHAMAEEIQRSIDAGCDAHLTKPITKLALVDCLCFYVGKALEPA